MLFLLLLFMGLAIGGGFGGTAKADLVVSKDRGDTWYWVLVTEPNSGRTAFATYRSTSATDGYFRSECWSNPTAAKQRLESLMEMSFENYRDSPMSPSAVGAGIDCGARIGKKLLEEFM